MKYKALILDLDGTTIPLAGDHASARVKDAITKAQKKVSVCVATNRPLFIAKPIIDELGIKGFCSVHDVTQIYDPVKNRIIDVVELDHEFAEKAYAIIKSFHPNIILVGVGEKEYEYTGGAWPEDLCTIVMPDLPPESVDGMVTELTKIAGIAVHKMPSFTKGLFWIAITSAEATKLHAVMRLCELMKISPSEAIGVGDSYNDYPLLTACGLKIAIGNAVPELKAIADFVAPSVEEDGVATVIEKFILNN